MNPPVLNVGWEFVQSQPLLYKGNVFPAANAANGGANLVPTDPTMPVSQMKAYRMRIRLKATAAVYIKASFNIDKLYYNELIFDLDQFLSYVFGDLIFIYND